ncbi:MAG: TetR/AcrR family transcriptional regulator [Actinomycetota bacterium]|nr:TetR/AcrR family transcriptional regulator [Actinomycetota bacterium]
MLEAVADLLAEGGVAAVSPAAVGARAGIARSSVYTYFDSAESMIAAVVEDALPRAEEELRAATEASADPAGRIDAYLRTAIDLAARGAHRTAAVLARADLPEPCRARLAELHASQREPLREAIRELGVEDADLVTGLLDGVLAAAMVAVQAGGQKAEIQEQVLRFVHAGLPGLSARQVQRQAPRTGSEL